MQRSEGAPGDVPAKAPRRSPYVQLFVVFACAWAALVAYAFAPHDLSFSLRSGKSVLFGGKIARSAVGDYLGVARASDGDELADEAALEGADGVAAESLESLEALERTGSAEGDADSSAAAAAGSEAPPLASAPAPADSSGRRVAGGAPERILMFGDSMIQSIQPRLGDYCLENGHKLLPAIWYGSTTVAWAVQAKLDQLIKEFKPTMVIAVLGSSEISSRNIDERVKFVRAILKKIGDRKVLWVGPPNWREDTGINALLERELGKGRFYRSAELKLDRIEDHIHPTAAAGVIWTEAFLAWVRDESDYPIALATPTRKAPKIPARVYPPPY